MINKAIQFATMVHSNQTRKSTNIPFITHCLEVGILITNMTTELEIPGENLISAGYLHDSVEDAHVTIAQLNELFNERIAELVDLQSEDKTKGWQERKDHTMELLKSNEDIELEIGILADKLSNVRSLDRDYKIQGEKLWERFNAPKERQEWYYKSIAENLKFVRNLEEYVEYVETVNKIFK